jgi:hypothetical protein
MRKELLKFMSEERLALQDPAGISS